MNPSEPGSLCSSLAHARSYDGSRRTARGGYERERVEGSNGGAVVRLLVVLAFASMVAASEAADPSAARASHQLKPHPDAKPNIHAPGEVDRPELVPYIVASPASLPGIVMDETEAKLEGTWQYSTHTPPYVGLGYLHDLREGKGAKSATFTP